MKSLILVAALALAARADEEFMSQVGKHAAEVLEGADKVESFRTLAEKDDTAGANLVDGYPVVKTGLVKDAAFAKRILAQLKHEDTGPNDLECAFQPHDAFRVWKGKDHVDVLICYHCEQVQVTSYPPTAADPVRALGDFENKAGPWFALSREAFPDDADLRRMEAAAVGPSKRVKQFLGEGILKVLQDIESIEIFRIKPREKHSITGPLIADQEILGESRESVDDLRLILMGVLLDEKTYEFGSVKGCTFEPGIAFRITNQDHETVEVLVCLTCDEVMITRVPEEGQKPERKHEDSDGARDALVRIAKQAFPDDAVIQGLKEKR